MKKRLLSLLLAFVLVLSLAPVLTASAATYNIWVCGKQITDDNCDDVLGDGAVRFQVSSGKYYLYINKDVSYDNGSSQAIIESWIHDTLNVIVTADVTLTRTVGVGGVIYHKDELYVTGLSKLTGVSTGSAGGAIDAEGLLQIWNANLDVKGGKYGLHGNKIELKNSTVAASGSENAIRADEGLTVFEGMGVIQPVGGQIFGSDIRDKDGAPATEVLLAPVENFDLTVCGKQVNTANMGDILGDGVFSFDPEKKLLTINGDCEYMGNIIESRVRGLTVYPAKDATLKAIDGHGIVTYGTEKGAHPSDRMALPDLWLTTEGSKLTMVCSLSCIFADNTRVRIFNSDLELSGKNGIIGPGSSLNIDESTVSIKGSTAAVSGFDVLSLTGCYIKAPEGAEIADGGIKVDGALAQEVLIAPDATTYTVTFDVNGHGTAPAGQLVKAGETVAKPADPTEDGWVFGGWFTDAACTTPYDFSKPVTAVLKLYAKWTPEETPIVLVNPFVDVKESDYFYDAVLWAYYAKPQVTNGLDATHFGPARTCTRGQIVTFLWRALGEPAPTITKNPFADVKESDYFYKAVLWAVEKGVTNGTDATHFSPNASCRREHAVAFLYRAAGNPEYSNKTNPFVDVTSSAYYYDAVLWAVEKNITKGMDATHFGPASACQRSQIVTFLYRFMNP